MEGIGERQVNGYWPIIFYEEEEIYHHQKFTGHNRSVENGTSVIWVPMRVWIFLGA